MTLQANDDRIRDRAKAPASQGRADDAWPIGFRSLETELAGGREVEVLGELPRELDGTLYRIGPARHDVYGERYAHWFDGDGMVHALQLRGGRVVYKNRFVVTKGKRAEDAARRRLHATFGTEPKGNVVSRFLRRRPKNSANTNIVFHAGKLRALFEAGRPHLLDPKTLETIGEDDMSGTLGANATYSAHPKLDPRTGEMWNFGVCYGPESFVDVYVTSAKGVTTRFARVKLPFHGLIHDFEVTETKIVVIVPPVALKTVPLRMAIGQESFASALRWRPELGTRICVIDRATRDVRWHHADPFMMFHTIRAWEDGKELTVDVCAYEDDAVLRALRDVMIEPLRAGRAPAFPERLRIRANGRVERSRLSSTSLEFPRGSSESDDRLYGVSWPEGLGFLGLPVAVDLATGNAEHAARVPGEFAGECVPVKKAGATSSRDVWLLTVVLDAAHGRSELRVLDGDDLSRPPVARVRMPHVIPFGFHGNWVAGV